MKPISTAKDPRPKLVVKRFTLTVIAGPDKGKSLRSEGEPVIIGTEAPAQLVLADKKASRLHCEIAVRDGRAIVRDERSTNGTAVDGVRVHVAELADGQTLAIGGTKLRFEIGQDRATVATSERTRFGDLVGTSLAIRAVFAKLEKIAKSDKPVLIEGETGTGKELAARSIHDESGRRGLFVIVDVAGLPSASLETELLGAFELAKDGTVFLDEIGDLADELQPKLLRLLEGGPRVIASTSRNLRHEVNDKRFRAELYFRLAVLELHLPPLRERPDDLPVLLDHFLAETGGEAIRRDELLAELRRRTWLGNVRELKNFIAAARELGMTPTASELANTLDAALAIDPMVSLKENRERWLAGLERAYVQQVLDRAGGNVTHAAKAAGISRVQFHRYLWRTGIR